MERRGANPCNAMEVLLTPFIWHVGVKDAHRVRSTCRAAGPNTDGARPMAMARLGFRQRTTSLHLPLTIY